MGRNKRAVLPLILIVLCVGQGFALDWGLKLGLSRVGYQLSGDAFPLDYEKRLESLFGAFIEIPITPRLSLQPEILFPMFLGVDFYTDSGWRFKHEIQYLVLPVLLKYRIPFKGRSIPNVYLGPYYARELGSETINIFDNFDQFMVDHQGDLEDAVSDSDYGMVFGGSVELDVCFGKAIVDVRYHWGLSNILTNPLHYNDRIKIYGAFSEGDSLKNKALVLMFGIGF